MNNSKNDVENNTHSRDTEVLSVNPDHEKCIYSWFNTQLPSGPEVHKEMCISMHAHSLHHELSI